MPDPDTAGDKNQHQQVQPFSDRLTTTEYRVKDALLVRVSGEAGVTDSVGFGVFKYLVPLLYSDRWLGWNLTLQPAGPNH